MSYKEDPKNHQVVGYGADVRKNLNLGFMATGIQRIKPVQPQPIRKVDDYTYKYKGKVLEEKIPHLSEKNLNEFYRKAYIYLLKHGKPIGNVISSAENGDVYDYRIIEYNGKLYLVKTLELYRKLYRNNKKLIEYLEKNKEEIYPRIMFITPENITNVPLFLPPLYPEERTDQDIGLMSYLHKKINNNRVLNKLNIPLKENLIEDIINMADEGYYLPFPFPDWNDRKEDIIKSLKETSRLNLYLIREFMKYEHNKPENADENLVEDEFYTKKLLELYYKYMNMK